MFMREEGVPDSDIKGEFQPSRTMGVADSQAQGDVTVMKAYLGKKAMDWFQHKMQVDYITALSRASITKRSRVRR